MEHATIISVDLSRKILWMKLEAYRGTVKTQNIYGYSPVVVKGVIHSGAWGLRVVGQCVNKWGDIANLVLNSGCFGGGVIGPFDETIVTACSFSDTIKVFLARLTLFRLDIFSLCRTCWYTWLKATHVLIWYMAICIVQVILLFYFCRCRCTGIAYLFIRYDDDTCIKIHGGGKNLQIFNAGLSAACTIEWPSNFYAYLFLFPLVI